MVGRSKVPWLDLGREGARGHGGVAAALFAMALDFEREAKHPLQAIKCLEAAAGADFLPQVEAEARANLGLMLMRYTHNVREARVHLEKASHLVDGLPISADFKLGVVLHLSTCHRLLGSPQSYVHALDKGIAMVTDDLALGGDGQARLLDWFVLFQGKRVQHLLDAGEAEAALEVALVAVAEMERRASTKHVLQVRICLLQLFLREGSHADAETQVQSCSAALETLRAEQGTDAGPVLELASQFHLMHALFAVRFGSAPQISHQLACASSALAQLRSGGHQTSTPMAYLESLRAVLTCYVLTTFEGGLKKAGYQQVRSHIGALESDLDACDIEDGANQSLKLPFVCMLLHSLATSYLADCKLCEALDAITRLAGHLERAPTSLAAFEPLMHLLIASWSRLAGMDSEVAQRHCRHAMEAPGVCGEAVRDVAALQMWLADPRSRDGPPSSVGGGADEEDGREGNTLGGRLMMAGVIAGDRHKLTEALKGAHQSGQRRLVVLCLLELAKTLTQGGDVTQANESMEAAKEMAAAARDMPALLWALFLKKDAAYENVASKWLGMVDDAAKTEGVQPLIDWRLKAS